MSTENLYDLIILGGGPAGYNAGAYASIKGLSVLLFEKANLGGVCLNEGCVPSKTLLNSAKVYSYVKNSSHYGVNIEYSGGVSQEEVINRKNKVVKRLVVGIRSKLKNAGVNVIYQNAKILGKNDNLFEVVSNDIVYKSKYLFVCTGSLSVIVPIDGVKEGLEQNFVLTNREILNLTKIPQNLVVIGGGVIGLEMADYYQTVGSQVTVIEALDKIAGKTDIKTTDVLYRALSKKGVNFKLCAKVIKIENNGVTYQDENGQCTIYCDKVLLSVGRRANINDIGLENLNVEIAHNAIVTNEKLQTNVKNLYAFGDVNGKSMLAHTAYREGEVAVNDILNIDDKINYKSIPQVIYTTPEVASVGLTEKEAKDCGINAKSITLSLMYSGRYIAENTDYTGICTLVKDEDKNTLIGAHIVGNYASEYIVSCGELIDLEVDIERIKKIVFPHPTVCEVIREGMFEL